MIKLWNISVLAILLIAAQSAVLASTDQSLAGIIEQAIRQKDPTCKLRSKRGSGGILPEEIKETVGFLWRCNGKDVSVGFTSLTSDQAVDRHFSLSTITAIMRRGYKLSNDGQELKLKVDQAGFYKNNSPGTLEGGTYRETYDVAFRKGRVVVVVEAFRSAVAQRIALLVAESLPPD